MDTNPRTINMELIKLIFDYIRAKHPLGASIPRESVTNLSKELALRLGVDDGELDFSPDSLKLVEKLLAYYHTANPQFSDDETMILIRELAAYIGEVLVRHTDGKWVLLGESIWGSRIRYEGEWTVVKENKRRSVSKVAYTLADIAAVNWRNVLNGKPQQLFNEFKNIQKRELREELTYKK